jgi:hypothetical protein
MNEKMTVKAVSYSTGHSVRDILKVLLTECKMMATAKTEIGGATLGTVIHHLYRDYGSNKEKIDLLQSLIDDCEKEIEAEEDENEPGIVSYISGIHFVQGKIRDRIRILKGLE